MSVVRIGNLA